MYTRCPECETMFHLSVEDLRQAGGRVRCGECTHVFYGMDFLAEEPDNDTGHFAIETETAEPAAAAIQNDPADDDDTGDVFFIAEDSDTAAPAAEIEDDDDEPGLSAELAEAIDEFIGAGSFPETGIDIEAEPEAAVDEILFTSDDAADTAAQPIITDDSPNERLDEATEAEDYLYGADDDEAETEDDGEDYLDEHDDDEAEADYYLVEEDTEEDESQSDDYLIEQELADGDTDADDYLVEQNAEDTDAEDLDIDDTIWDRIPGVGAIESDFADLKLSAAQADDTGAFLDEPEAAIGIEAASADLSEPDTADFTGAATEDAEAPGDRVDPDATLEFNVPEEKWSTVFDTDANISTEPDRIIVPDMDLETVPNAEVETTPPWQFNKYSNIDLGTSKGRAGLWLVGCLVALALLFGQLVHYNRDKLATHPEYGEKVRSAYERVGMPLYPTWPIEDYEIRGSEAVVGETGPDVMDIRTQIAAIGEHAVGLPLLRVVLRDRWSNAVAARNFTPAEYAAATELPADNLLAPSSTVSARVSIFDPGSGAQGYELELCVPHRNDNLRCTGAAFK